MKVAIFTLFQKSEIEGTVKAVQMLEKQLGESTQLFLLGNGLDEHDVALLNEIGNSFVNVYSSPINLGVAGGRNYLIEKIRSSYDADIFISLDNDIIVPDDYCNRIVQSFNRIKKELVDSGKLEKRVGIIAPLVIQGTELKDLSLTNYVYPNETDLLDVVSETYFGKGNKGVIYHAGVKGWVVHYLSNPGAMLLFRKIYNVLVHPIIYKLFKIEFTLKVPTTFMAHDKMYMHSLLRYRQPNLVDTLSGGLHCFEKSFLEEVGTYDNRFNPFGYEDADFCIRGLKKYYSHYVVPELMVIHDVDRRYFSRSYIEKLEVKARCKKNLILNFVKNPLALAFRYLDFLVLYPIAIRNDLKKMNEKLSLNHLKVFWKSFL